jgi:uracil-DNA glycosylase
MDPDAVESEISACHRCSLSETRKNAVPGEGPKRARIMLIGEAPGAQEDVTGKPFVGSCGKLLDQALAKAGLERSEVFITSVVKCRPPENRQPKRIEVQACLPYLKSQIEAIKPDVICLMGNVATKALLGKTGVTKMHGEVFDDRFLVTFHPAALLRNRKLEETFISDLKKLSTQKQRASSP